MHNTSEDDFSNRRNLVNFTLHDAVMTYTLFVSVSFLLNSSIRIISKKNNVTIFSSYPSSYLLRIMFVKAALNYRNLQQDNNFKFSIGLLVTSVIFRRIPSDEPFYHAFIGPGSVARGRSKFLYSNNSNSRLVMKLKFSGALEMKV